MTIQELKENIYDLVAKYFTGATVVWAEEYMAKPKYPLVTIKAGTVKIGNMDIEGEIDGEHSSTYNCMLPIEINLYTKGESILGENNMVIAQSNSAVNDLTMFVAYMQSPFSIDEQERLDICMLLNGPVNDISSVLQDGRYEYRAMIELNVTFTMGFYGAYNTNTKTPSGGGNDDLIGSKAGYFEEVEIKEEKE